MSDISELTKDGFRALFVFGITQEFFDQPREKLPHIGKAIKGAFANLGERFNVKVLGTFDDDLLSVGVTRGYPYISYILAEIPNLEAVIEITNLVRTPYEDGRLARFLTIDARIGHPLFFGNE
jgi:hypothetical protein